MSTVEELRRRQEALVRQIEEIDQKIEKLSKFAEPAGGVIMFTRKFDARSRTYTYAALRIVNRWYLTGETESRKSYTWQELVEAHLADSDSVWSVKDWGPL